MACRRTGTTVRSDAAGTRPSRKPDSPSNDISSDGIIPVAVTTAVGHDVLDTLTVELMGIVLGSLDAASLGRVGLTSTLWHYRSLHDGLWEGHCADADIRRLGSGRPGSRTFQTWHQLWLMARCWGCERSCNYRLDLNGGASQSRTILVPLCEMCMGKLIEFKSLPPRQGARRVFEELPRLAARLGHDGTCRALLKAGNGKAPTNGKQKGTRADAAYALHVPASAQDTTRQQAPRGRGHDRNQGSAEGRDRGRGRGLPARSGAEVGLGEGRADAAQSVDVDGLRRMAAAGSERAASMLARLPRASSTPPPGAASGEA